MKNMFEKAIVILGGFLIIGSLIWLVVAQIWTYVIVLGQLQVPVWLIWSFIVAREFGATYHSMRLRRIEKALGVD